MWMNLRYTFTSPAQTDSAEWCAQQTVIALGVFSICIYAYMYIYTHIYVHIYCSVSVDLHINYIIVLAVLGSHIKLICTLLRVLAT